MQTGIYTHREWRLCPGRGDSEAIAKGRFTPPNPQRKKAGQLTESAFAYPVIADGRLYIRDLDALWAYDIKASR
jgi:hypothetical protein